MGGFPLRCSDDAFAWMAARAPESITTLLNHCKAEGAACWMCYKNWIPDWPIRRQYVFFFLVVAQGTAAKQLHGLKKACVPFQSNCGSL